MKHYSTQAYGHINSQTGVALITVMMMAVVIVGILASIFYRHGIDIARATKTLHSEQASLLALSGESWAISILKEDLVETGNLDTLLEPWAVGLPILPVEGGSLSGQLEDLQAKLNINGFASYNNASLNIAINNANSSPQLNSLYSVFLNLGFAIEQNIEQTHIAALIDWQDNDDIPLPGGAEENEYLIKEPAYRPANNTLVEVDELQLVEGFEPEMVAALKPHISVIPAISTVQINVNTASTQVLQALHQDINESIADSLAETRDTSPWESPDEFYDTLGLELGITQGQAKALIEGPNFNPVVVATSYFLLTVFVQLGDNTIQLQSIINRKGPNDVVVLARTLQFLPNTITAAKT